MNHFQKRFQPPDGFPSTYVVDMVNLLPQDQSEFLEHDISRDEIKRAVWDCGDDRAPGPDGFTFKFFTSFWDLIEVDTFPNISGVILEKGISDHCLILIKDYVVDFGPTLFWFFHSWFEIEGFHSMVVDTWKNDGIVEANGLISFKKKLQNLKRVIREWVALQRSISLTLKKDHLRRLSSVDTKIDQGLASELDLCDRRESICILGDLDKWEASDIA
nr:RNA-directed DNA polymerase, eukaryota, reverse transcriptase zinc-binding domain protein [Tanacetum cinerariifolium]